MINCFVCNENASEFNEFECNLCNNIYCEDCAIEGEYILTCTKCDLELCHDCFQNHLCVVELKKEEFK